MFTFNLRNLKTCNFYKLINIVKLLLNSTNSIWTYQLHLMQYLKKNVLSQLNKQFSKL